MALCCREEVRRYTPFFSNLADGSIRSFGSFVTHGEQLTVLMGTLYQASLVCSG